MHAIFCTEKDFSVTLPFTQKKSTGKVLATANVINLKKEKLYNCIHD